MKTIKFFVALSMGLAMVACAPKGEAVETEEGEMPEKTASMYKATKGQVDTVSYLLGVNFGSMVKGYDFGDMNISQIVKGMKDMINSKGNFNDPSFVEQFKVNPEMMGAIINEYLQNRQMFVSLKNKEDGAAFLEKNAKKTGVQSTESGLQYIVVTPGSEDVKAGPVDTVKVYYKGTLIDGTVFDETKEDGEPATLELNHVIPGWTEGLQLVGEGGEIQLFIPSELAYGVNAPQGIGPNSVLIFNVKIVSVAKAIAE